MSEAKEKFEAACKARREVLHEEVTDRQRVIGMIDLLLGEGDEENGEKPKAPVSPKPRSSRTGKKATGKKESGELADILAVILIREGHQKIDELITGVRKADYRIKAKDKKQALYGVLRRDSRFYLVSRGLWALKK